jgi:hypothetical protein
MRVPKKFLTTVVLLLIGLLFDGIGLSPRARGSLAGEQGNQFSPVILSNSQLTPPLRTPLQELRFSPDGKYVLVQDESTIYLLTRDPLSVRFQVEAQNIPPVRFSADSQKLIIATRAMGVEWRALPNGAVLGTTVLGPGNTCYDAELSPHGDFYACIDREIVLRVFDIAKNRQIFGEKVGEAPLSYVAPQSPEESSVLPKWRNGVRGLPHLQTSIEFSPDARFVFATSFHGQSIAVDLTKKTGIRLKDFFPPTFDERSFQFIGPDRVVQDGSETRDLSIFSFPGGGPVGKIPNVGRITLASDPRYAFSVGRRKCNQTSVIDLNTGSIVQKLKGEKADILRDDIVRYDRAKDEIVLGQIENSKPTVEMKLPVGSISLVNATAVSRDLQSVAIGVPGDGAVFQTSVGNRKATVENLQGAWFDGDERCYAEVRKNDGGVSLENIALTEGDASSDSPPWFLAINQTKARLLFSGPVVISIARPRWSEGELISESKAPRSIPELAGVAFEKTTLNDLTLNPPAPKSSAMIGASDVARDVRTGNQLWSRTYNPEARFQYGTDVPLWEDVGKPFADPQGNRFIYSWYANTSTARKATKGASKAVQNQMKTSRISGQDSFFEVVDALTGTTVGGALVQHGDGPGSFQEAFSAGDWIVVSGGGKRFSVLSLSSGKELLNLFALSAALSGVNGLLGVGEERGSFAIYDLTTGKKVRQFAFPENIVCAHFSTDGQRALVVTDHQQVYILDLSKSPGALPTRIK